MAKKGDWVRIHRNILEASQRTANVPDDTKAVPFEMWVKGRLVEDAEIGQECKVITRTGREDHGTLLEVNPQYVIDYGDFVPEVLEIDERLRGVLFGGEQA